MGAKDFIHRQLIGAGSRDAVSNMLVGAGIGAAANTGLGVAQGDFGVIGNATSGALLGAGAGAAMRHMGAKYGNALNAERNVLAREGASSMSKADLKTSIYTEAKENPAMDFWGKEGDADLMNQFKDRVSSSSKSGPKAGADTSAKGSAPVPPAPSTFSGGNPPPIPNPFPGQSAQRSPLPGIGSDFSGASANTGSGIKSTYGGNRANFTSNTPMPNRAAPSPAESSDGLDGARAAIKRADEWKASEKARIKQEKRDTKDYTNWKKENATYGGENKRPMTGGEYQGYKDKQQSKVDARNAEVQKRALIKQQGIERQQENAALEAQARKEMYG